MKKKLRSILLIDDDSPTNYLHRLVLDESGCAAEIQVFQSTEKALHFIAYAQLFDYAGYTQGPDSLILLDINMPRMDGWEFLAAYSQLPDSRKKMFVIILLTTSLNPDDESAAGRVAEVKGFYNKPLTSEKLREILRTNFAGYL